MNIYIIYSSENVEQAKKLTAQLRQDNFLVQQDLDFIKAGQVFNLRIEQMLRGCDIVLVLLTQSARASHWVNEEIIFALNHNTPVIPIKLEKNVEPVFGLQAVQFVEMFDDNLWTLNYPHLIETLKNYKKQVEDIELNRHSTEETHAVGPGTDPFVTGSAVHGDLFFGRTKVVQAIVQRLTGPVLQSFSIVANRRMGKSSLFKHLSRNHSLFFPADRNWVVINIDMMSAKAHTQRAFMHALRRQLKKKLPDQYQSLVWSQNENGELMCMVQSLEDLYEEDVSTVLLLDEWEEAQARPELNQMVDTLRALASASNIAIVTATSHELISLYYVTKEFMKKAGYNPADTSSFANIFRSKVMGGMLVSEWEQLVTQAFDRSKRELRPRDLTLIAELAGGHPYFTQLAGSIIWNSIEDGASEKKIRQQCDEEAKPILTELWHKITVENQEAVLKHVLEIEEAHHLSEVALEQSIDRLTDRGVLDRDGNIFSTAFSDFIYNLDRNDG